MCYYIFNKQKQKEKKDSSKLMNLLSSSIRMAFVVYLIAECGEVLGRDTRGRLSLAQGPRQLQSQF